MRHLGESRMTDAEEAKDVEELDLMLPKKRMVFSAGWVLSESDNC